MKPGLINSTKLAFKKSFTINESTGRADYWWFYLGYLLIKIFLFIMASFAVLPLIGSFLIMDSNLLITTFSFFMLSMIITLYLLLKIPYITITIRRYKDINMSGWFTALLIFSTIGFIINFIFMCMPSKNNNNRQETSSNKTIKRSSDNSKKYLQRRSIMRNQLYKK
ncbi:DUF805 domain-containing protein [Companilactobacillus sp. DQM5]|uniref:DUF805 domain-containing protein n=1 Tax=Companilactobacillus sp. DQM5 TaxID=3463359 RepID=UPI004059D9BE